MTYQEPKLAEDRDVFENAENHLSVLQRMSFAEKLAKLGYWELDIKAKRFYWSAEMYQIFGVNPELINSKQNLFRERILPEDFAIYKNKLLDLLKYHKPVEGEIRIRHTSGNIIYGKFTAGIKGRRIAGTFQNISDWIIQCKKVEKALARAEAACQAKTYFLAQASHDLRQPLQALQLFTEALEDSNPTEEQRPLIQKIDASVDNFRLMLDNLLDFSKLEADKLYAEPKDFNLSQMLMRLCGEYQAIAANRNVSLRCQIPLIGIHSDYLFVERILRNLLSNAIKYAQSKVIMSCTENEQHIVIRIMDNGMGIDKDERKQIFEEFYQSKNIPNNRQLGAGLGLSIVKKLTQLIQGKITLRSQKGKYTSFNLYLPHKI